jgi:small subunit ribosomal protein S20
MPNIKSAKKRMRIEEKRRLRNNTVKSAVRTQLTKARSAIVAAPEAETTEAAIREAISNLDHAASKGVIHKNNAARRKSRLMAKLHATQEAHAAK